MRVRRGPVIAIAALLVSCSAVLGIHDPELETSPFATDTDEGGDTTTPTRPTDGRDAAGDARSTPGTDSDAGSGGDAGGDAESVTAKMIRVPAPGGGTFEIDSTEVTQAQYAVFLAQGAATAVQGAECQSNALFAPSGFYDPVKTPNHPVVQVDWCDAVAYCKWAGKRLCGGVGGDGGAYADMGNPAKNEWMAACTRAGTAAYPYGPTEQPTACNIYSADAGGTRAVGSRATCEGGYAGLFDMVGNATEWMNHCDVSGCGILGGSFSFPSNGQVQCSLTTQTGRGAAFPDLSFRCCR